MNRIFFLILFLMASVFLRAQEPPMADTFRAEGKIYIVIGVMLIIFLSIVLFLVRIERKIRKLEDRQAGSASLKK